MAAFKVLDKQQPRILILPNKSIIGLPIKEITAATRI